MRVENHEKKYMELRLCRRGPWHHEKEYTLWEEDQRTTCTAVNYPWENIHFVNNRSLYICNIVLLKISKIYIHSFGGEKISINNNL